MIIQLDPKWPILKRWVIMVGDGDAAVISSPQEARMADTLKKGPPG
jgi:hypothetical protein